MTGARGAGGAVWLSLAATLLASSLRFPLETTSGLRDDAQPAVPQVMAGVGSSQRVLSMAFILPVRHYSSTVTGVGTLVFAGRAVVAGVGSVSRRRLSRGRRSVGVPTAVLCSAARQRSSAPVVQRHRCRPAATLLSSAYAAIQNRGRRVGLRRMSRNRRAMPLSRVHRAGGGICCSTGWLDVTCSVGVHPHGGLIQAAWTGYAGVGRSQRVGRNRLHSGQGLYREL
jgi:hypothetical protein